MIQQSYSYRHALKIEAVRFIVSLCALAKTGNPNVHQEQSNKLWYLYMMECHMAVGMNEPQLHTCTQMNFRNSEGTITEENT